MDAAESRFAHLLQPLRDLARNWGVDLAQELTDYINELADATFSFDGGNSSLNFAEAALLIQGSTCIYSRKVEYLHALVYQALQFVTDKRRAEASRGTEDGEEGAGPMMADDDEADEVAFLSLDDVLEEGTGIDLDESAEARGAARARAALAGTSSGAALLALSNEPADAGSDHAAYRISTCAVHSSGALLLEPREAALLDQHLVLTPAAGRTPVEEDAPVQVDDDDDDDDFANDVGAEIPMGDAPEIDAAPEQAGADPGEAPAPPAEEDPAQVVPADEDVPVAAGGATVEMEEDEEEEAFDPFAMLDPDDPGGLPSKPFRRGRTYRKLGKADADLSLEEVDDPSWPLPAPLTGLAFAEFADYLADLRKSRRRGAASAREATGGAAFSASDVTLAQEQDDGEEDAGEIPELGPGLDDDEDVGVPDGFGWGADVEDDGAGSLTAAVRAGAAELAAAVAGAHDDGPSYEELCRKHVERCLSAAAAAEVQSELASRVSSWKAKIDPALSEQDARGHFDIHEYGGQVVESIEAAAATPDAPDTPEAAVEPKRFGDVVASREGWEVCRMFAATLQLVNDGNVDIVQEEDGDGFSVSLLSATMRHTTLGDYRAPSQLPPTEKEHPQEKQRARGKQPQQKRPRKGALAEA